MRRVIGLWMCWKGEIRTFGSIRCLVIFGKPLEVLVLDPRHPCFVLLVVVLSGLLLVRLGWFLVLVRHFWRFRCVWFRF